eukprot:TRINITY_DN1409_c0_g2_i5.p1 TRINITY_DN1409_c0_g2~~TRINITY_DN1409_c0_g2_i5.p1  ORF type:complete len:219 (-),score=34.00 TRINITY_DN1409_c0_g2_i5:50-706(-)
MIGLRSISSSSRLLSVLPRHRAYASTSNGIVLPPLPYDLRALEPHLSEATLSYHYGKHHSGYVDRLNTMITEDERDLEVLVRTLPAGVKFNMAGQIYNHNFYWNSMAPNAGGEPHGEIATRILKEWGSFRKFKEEFEKAGVSLFGSGWVWLVKEGETLKIVQTSNADCPIRHGQVPLLTCDVWEHAYYIDYYHQRPLYLQSWWNLVNWDFANKNLSQE